MFKDSLPLLLKLTDFEAIQKRRQFLLLLGKSLRKETLLLDRNLARGFRD